MEQSPTARSQPRSSPKDRHKTSNHYCKAPNPARHRWDTKHVRNRVPRPGAVVVEIVRSRRVRRNIAGGNGVLLAQIALIRPLVEAVGSRRLVDAGLNVLRAIENAALASMDGVRLAVGGDLPF